MNSTIRDIIIIIIIINMYFHQWLPAIYLSPYVVLLHNVITYMYTVLSL
jgi:hypothetical protein